MMFSSESSSLPHRQQKQLNTIFYSLAYVVVYNITQTNENLLKKITRQTLHEITFLFAIMFQ